MADALTTKSAHDLIKRAVTTLGTGELAKKVVAPTDAAFELARQTAIAAQGGKGAAVITSIEVAVNKGSGGVKSPPVRFGFASREPIDQWPEASSAHRLRRGLLLHGVRLWLLRDGLHRMGVSEEGVAAGRDRTAFGGERGGYRSGGPPSTSGLGPHPFKVVTRVRIPLGV